MSKSWLEKLKPESSISMPSIDLSQTDKYNIYKQIKDLYARLDYVGNTLVEDINNLGLSAEKLTSTVSKSTSIISSSVEDIAKTLSETTQRVASTVQVLGNEFYEGAKRVDKPASYIAGEIKDAHDELGDLKRHIESWDVVKAVKDLRDMSDDLINGFQVMTYSKDEGGPLFGQLITAFQRISAAAIETTKAFINFGTQNYTTINNASIKIQNAATNALSAIQNFTNAFLIIFTNLANTIRGK